MKDASFLLDKQTSTKREIENLVPQYGKSVNFGGNYVER
jgi:hypothetical protein